MCRLRRTCRDAKHNGRTGALGGRTVSGVPVVHVAVAGHGRGDEQETTSRQADRCELAPGGPHLCHHGPAQLWPGLVAKCGQGRQHHGQLAGDKGPAGAAHEYGSAHRIMQHVRIYASVILKRLAHVAVLHTTKRMCVQSRVACEAQQREPT